MNRISKSKLLLILIIPLIISGCSILSNEKKNADKNPDLERNVSVIDSERKIENEENEGAEKIDEKAKEVNESEKEKEREVVLQVSKMAIHPVYAELNKSTGRWDVVFKLEFLTNIRGEKGRWQLFLYNSEKLVDKKNIDTTEADAGIQGFKVNYAVKQVKEGEKYRIKAIKEFRFLQPGGSTAASYKIQKEIDVNFNSEVKLISSTVSCNKILYKINYTGLIPAKLSIEVKFPKKSFFKTFRVVGGKRYDVDFDSNLNRNIFEVKNGESEIDFNLEKFLRIASTPETNAEVSLKSEKILSATKFEKPNVTVKAGTGKIMIENGNGSLPIYIDSIVLVDANAKTIPVGMLLCDRIEIESGYHGRLLVIGGPNLFWSDDKERYLTKKPEYILFDGEI
jgi:hypothetical protein